MFRNKLINGVMAVLAFTVLAFLYVNTSAVSPSLYFDTLSSIRYLQRIDADWNAEALKTRAALNKDFDPLANILPKLREVRKSLAESEIGNADSSTPEINELLSNLLKLFDEKEQNIEQFKSGHAVLRNSIRFLPTAVKEVIDTAQVQKNAELREELHSYVSNLYSYVLLTDAKLKSLLFENLNSIMLEFKGMDEETSGALNRFKSHARIVLERHDVTIKLLEDSIAIPTESSALNLIDKYNEFHEQRMTKVDRYRLLLIGYSMLLVIALIIIGLKLTRSYRDLNIANANLKRANETLEEKVEERTRKLKESQSALVQSEKMAAIGQMVAGVAHEINTPLGYVHSNVEIIQDIINMVDEVVKDFVKFCNIMNDPKENDELIHQQINLVNEHVQTLQSNDLLSESKELLNDSKFGLEQIADIVVTLKDFSRKDRSEEEEFDINEGLESTLKIAFNIYKNSANIVKEYGTLPKIFCSPSKINQVFLNLITNAAHAIAENKMNRGTIFIKTGANDNHVFISIKDNGIGIPEHAQQKIFEPFFTTKEVGKGTGLGLSISHNIIKEHNGEIKLLSKSGIGTNFLIILPIKHIPVETIQPQLYAGSVG